MADRHSSNSRIPVSREALMSRVFAMRDKALREGNVAPEVEESTNVEPLPARSSKAKSTSIPKNIPTLPYRKDIDG